jgi:hypothetical protein
MRITGLLFLILLVSCQDIKMPEKPANLISEDKMVDILVDTYLSNSARSIDNRLIIDKGIKLDSFIYTKYAIDSTQFEKSNAYYTVHLNEFADLFRKVEERLIVLQEAAKSDKKSTSEEKQDGIESKGLINPPINQEEKSSEE